MLLRNQSGPTSLSYAGDLVIGNNLHILITGRASRSSIMRKTWIAKERS